MKIIHSDHSVRGKRDRGGAGCIEIRERTLFFFFEEKRDHLVKETKIRESGESEGIFLAGS
jgi:hypothetical protein